MAMKKVTKRWLLNNFSIILLILIILIIAFAFGVRTYYYSAVRQSVLSEASLNSTLIDRYAQNSSVDYSAQIRTMVGAFEAKDRMELMALDATGNVLVTSSGFDITESMEMPDFQQAMSSADGTGEYTGKFGNERIMAITVANNSPGSDVAALRYVVSMEHVESHLAFLTFFIVLAGVGILALVIFSSTYFMNSIVSPVGEIGATARKIAQGDFDAKLEKKNDDEVGELCEIVNYMADELKNAETMKNDFISSVSHELRTPLTAIRGWGETMRDDESHDPETVQKGINVILRETDRLSDMVEELLDFSRIQSGRLKLVMAKMDILAELDEAVLMYTERAKREGMNFVYEDTQEASPVLGDANRLRQVFINIIDNALKYSDPGDTITVSSQVTEHEVIIKVADTGCGIKASDLPKIKTKFYKANLTRRGSGIGLAVADEIVQRHGGQLDIDSVEGEGTTVTIRFPLYEKKGEGMQILSSTVPIEGISPNEEEQSV